LEAFALARAYVDMDRFVFFQRQNDSTFVNCCEKVRRCLSQVPGAVKDFDDLCKAGADKDEVLWLLYGCGGLPGFWQTGQVFGLTAEQLTKGLATIEKAAIVIGKMERHPFGTLAAETPNVSPGLEKTLRDYVAIVRAARRDFSRGSHWFLNIAKARLVVHVIHYTSGAVHDREISGLIAAVTGDEYATTAQTQWRHKHNHLIQDTLDPYTVMTPQQREHRKELWKQIQVQAPELSEGFNRSMAGYNLIGKARTRKQTAGPR
jgi:hypothetical protein